VNLQEAFSSIKQALSVVRDVDLGGNVITLVPLTAEEETKVLESCQSADGSAYLVAFKLYTIAHAIRRINNEDIQSEVEIKGEDGKPIRITRYLFILKIVEKWESAIRDFIYDAYADLLLELDYKIDKNAKFKRFAVSRESLNAGKEEEPVPGFRKVEESKEVLTEAERLTERVKQEGDKVQTAMAMADQAAISRATR